MNEPRHQAPTDARHDTNPGYRVRVQFGTVQDALGRINATLHLSPRGPVSPAVRLGAAVLLAEWWSAVDSCGYTRDSLTSVGARLSSVALDVAQLAAAAEDPAAMVEAIQARRAADVPRIRQAERRHP